MTSISPLQNDTELGKYIGDLLLKEKESSLEELAEQAGIPNWTVSPEILNPNQREKFPSVRTKVINTLTSTEDLTTKCAAFTLLERLFAQDPCVDEKTAFNLSNTLTALGELIKKSGVTTSEQRHAIAIYSAAAECLLSHMGKGHITGITLEIRDGFLAALKVFEDLPIEDRQETTLDLKYARETIKRFPSNQKKGDFFPTGKSLLKLFISGATLDKDGAIEAGSELYDQAQKEMAAITRPWHEIVYIIHLLMREAVYKSSQSDYQQIYPAPDPLCNSSLEVLDLLSEQVVKKGPIPTGIVDRVCKFMGKSVAPKYPWQVLVSTARATAHVIFHYEGADPQLVYRRVLSSNQKKLGLFSLLPIANHQAEDTLPPAEAGSASRFFRDKAREKVEQGLVEVVSKLLEDKKIWQKFDATTRNIFDQGIRLFERSIRSTQLRERIQNLHRQALDDFAQRTTVWEGRKKKLQKQTANEQATLYC